MLNSRYQLNLLGAVPGTLPPDLERALLDWLWHKPGGIGYLAVPLYQPPPSKPGPFDRWLASLELLARLFPAWIAFAAPSIEWLWSHREAHYLWDFGPRPASSAYFPLSDDWRHKSARIQDWSTRVLILLRKYESSDCSR